MKKTERIQNIKLAIQTVDFDPSLELLRGIRTEMKNLMRIYGSILGADVYLCQCDAPEADYKLARIRVGVPGRDLIAEACSTTWMDALADVSSKLKNQIMNRY